MFRAFPGVDLGKVHVCWHHRGSHPTKALTRSEKNQQRHVSGVPEEINRPRKHGSPGEARFLRIYSNHHRRYHGGCDLLDGRSSMPMSGLPSQPVCRSNRPFTVNKLYTPARRMFPGPRRYRCRASKQISFC